MHCRPLTFDSGVCAGALEHEAQRRGRVTMAAGGLAGEGELQPDVEAARDARLAEETWVLEDQDAPLGLLLCEQVARFHQEGAQIVVVPQEGNRLGARLWWNDGAEHLPKRRGALGGKTAVELP